MQRPYFRLSIQKLRGVLIEKIFEYRSNEINFKIIPLHLRNIMIKTQSFFLLKFRNMFQHPTFILIILRY